MRAFRIAIAAGLLAAGVTSAAPINAAQQYDFQGNYRNGAVRIWQDYHLPQTDTVREALVIYGNATIDGTVDWDVHVLLGNVRLGPTAMVRGSLVVAAGDVTIDEGATIRRDLVVIGGITRAPASFAPDGEHVVFGGSRLGQTIRKFAPWVTSGLMFGRIMVASIPWLWSVAFMFLVLTLAISLLLHEPVGAFASALSARPFSAFATGVLVLVLTAPVCALLAATVIGIAVIPFLLCAVLVAWIIGKVGVVRWIGRTMVGPAGETETRGEALRSVLIGFSALMLLYLLPVIGVVTWAIVGVLGLGVATQHFLRGLRRERPAKPRPASPAPDAPPAAASTPTVEPLSRVDVTPAAEDIPLQYAAGDPAASQPYVHVPPSPPPPPPPPPAFERPAAPAPPVFGPGDLRAFPKAGFLDRLAALVLDVVLIAVVTSWFDRRMFGHNEDWMPWIFFAYSVGFWVWQGTTLGGIVCNLRIVRMDGRKLEPADAIIRGLGGILSVVAVGIGFLWMLRDPDAQTWHDKIAGTIVVRVPKGTPIGQ